MALLFTCGYVWRALPMVPDAFSLPSTPRWLMPAGHILSDSEGPAAARASLSAVSPPRRFARGRNRPT
eukprot:1149500-Pyramimonas_sp.AAC.1